LRRRECPDLTEDAPHLLRGGVPADETQVDQRPVRPGVVRRLTLEPREDVRDTDWIASEDR
jgi:hypothetical protein